MPTPCPGDKLAEIDQWILLKTEELVAKCRAWYDEYAFHKVYRAVYDFATTDLSAVWVDIVKDRLYTAGSQFALPPIRSNSRLSDRRTRWFVCSRPCCLSPPKKSGATYANPPAAPIAFTSHCCRNPAN